MLNINGEIPQIKIITSPTGLYWHSKDHVDKKIKPFLLNNSYMSHAENKSVGKMINFYRGNKRTTHLFDKHCPYDRSPGMFFAWPEIFDKNYKYLKL